MEKLPTRAKNALLKKKINNAMMVREFFPYKYYDCTTKISLRNAKDNEDICILGTVSDVIKDKKNGKTLIKIYIEENQSKEALQITFFGCANLFSEYRTYIGKEILAYGKLKIFYGKYFITNPPIFRLNTKDSSRIYPVHKNIKGVSKKTFAGILDQALTENLPDYLCEKNTGLYGINAAYKAIHYPRKMKDVEEAKKRIDFDKMIYFSYAMELKKNKSLTSNVCISSTKKTKEMIQKLPFPLTDSQKKTVNDIILKLRNKEQVNALVQGDVGSGKTIVAVILMSILVENGYQSILLAPTAVLAEQHYLEIGKYFNKEEIIYLHSGLKTGERKELLEKIKTGKAKFIVGTHSVFSDDVIYKNIGIIITDEEHKFGVAQKNKLSEKKKDNIPVISMSATPIPRTIVSTVFNGIMDVYNIEKPSGREEVKTTVFNKPEGIIKFLKMQLDEGRQGYVVCPMIDKADEESVMKNVLSVEETLAFYKKKLPDKKIEAVTGETKAEEAEKILDQFRNGFIDVLISTTVIEVGVNVPNANVIIINNAERFGLAGLHQLRGRVGRGSYQSYCILNSKDKENERLKIMTETTNGFEIAERDVELRGTGDLIGTNQSGFNEYINLVLRDKKQYEKAKALTKELILEKKGPEIERLHNRYLEVWE